MHDCLINHEMSGSRTRESSDQKSHDFCYIHQYMMDAALKESQSVTAFLQRKVGGCSTLTM